MNEMQCLDALESSFGGLLEVFLEIIFPALQKRVQQLCLQRLHRRVRWLDQVLELGNGFFLAAVYCLGVALDYLPVYRRARLVKQGLFLLERANLCLRGFNCFLRLSPCFEEGQNISQSHTE